MKEVEKINNNLAQTLKELEEKNSSIPSPSILEKCSKCGKASIIVDLYNPICLDCSNRIKKIKCEQDSKSSVPLKYREILSDNKEFLKMTKTESLFLYGNTGSGKTVFACSVLKKHILNGGDGSFISYPSFIMELQSSFKNDKELETPFEKAEKVANNWGLLVIDDLGAEKLTDFVKQTTYFILNEREQNCHDTIITSNFSLSQLDEQFDSRISSRIAGMCKIIKLSGNDRRIKSNG